jgi:hypothetical protein
MNLREAAQQAIADICAARLCEVNSMSSRQEMLRLMIKATDTLRAALEQADIVASDYPDSHQPEQEWQGLTEEERRHIYATTEEFGHEIARAIEAALEEKNK